MASARPVRGILLTGTMGELVLLEAAGCLPALLASAYSLGSLLLCLVYSTGSLVR